METVLYVQTCTWVQYLQPNPCYYQRRPNPSHQPTDTAVKKRVYMSKNDTVFILNIFHSDSVDYAEKINILVREHSLGIILSHIIAKKSHRWTSKCNISSCTGTVTLVLLLSLGQAASEKSINWITIQSIGRPNSCVCVRCDRWHWEGKDQWIICSSRELLSAQFYWCQRCSATEFACVSAEEASGCTYFWFWYADVALGFLFNRSSRFFSGSFASVALCCK